MFDQERVLAALPGSARHLEVELAERIAILVEERARDDDAFPRECKELQTLSQLQCAEIGAKVSSPHRRVLPERLNLRAAVQEVPLARDGEPVARLRDELEMLAVEHESVLRARAEVDQEPRGIVMALRVLVRQDDLQALLVAILDDGSAEPLRVR